ncbi:hypothetical protein FQN57_004936 [Myotisia sp. PD_48]|nr:hypothetical protein FQN57_004936 [Myotisia sp. PD_48]
MVLLKITPAILAVLETLPPPAREELGLCEAPALHTPISHSQLLALVRCKKLQAKSSSITDGPVHPRHISLDALLRGTDVYFPPPPPKPAPNSEYLALKARLQTEAEQLKYNTLIRPLSLAELRRQPAQIFASPSYKSSSNAIYSDDLDSDPISPSLVLNILVSILFTGFATYWALSNFRIPKIYYLLPWNGRPRSNSTSPSDYQEYYYYPHSPDSQPFRVFTGLAAGILVGVAEVVVYSAYLRKVDNAKKKEKAKIEKKELVDLVAEPISADELSTTAISVDNLTDEIWGKGVNGGARRRVQEKWKKEKAIQQETTP